MFFRDWHLRNFNGSGPDRNTRLFKILQTGIPQVPATKQHLSFVVRLEFRLILNICCLKSGALQMLMHSPLHLGLLEIRNHLWCPDTGWMTRHIYSRDMDFTHKNWSIECEATQFVAYFEVFANHWKPYYYGRKFNLLTEIPISDTKRDPWNLFEPHSRANCLGEILREVAKCRLLFLPCSYWNQYDCWMMDWAGWSEKNSGHPVLK